MLWQFEFQWTPEWIEDITDSLEQSLRVSDGAQSTWREIRLSYNMLDCRRWCDGFPQLFERSVYPQQVQPPALPPLSSAAHNGSVPLIVWLTPRGAKLNPRNSESANCNNGANRRTGLPSQAMLEIVVLEHEDVRGREHVK